MDTDFDITQARYAEFLAKVPDYLEQTLKRTASGDIEQLQLLLKDKKRIFFTGVGSSMPAAWHGAHKLVQQGYAAQFLATGDILGLDLLSDSDVVILSSQGINRADALLIIDKIATSSAHLVILTANRNPLFASQADLIYYFEPSEEKLFCRPAGVATNFALMEKILSFIDHSVSDSGLIKAWKQGGTCNFAIPDCQRFIILSSNEMMPVAWNVALAMREGSGLHTELFDIETYGHGNYVGDLQDRAGTDAYGYILLSGDLSTRSAKSVRRIMPFITAVKAPYTILGPDYNQAASASMFILATTAKKIYELNQLQHYNMNKPIGKEENRYYHELTSYDN